jgi:tRNA dimethylallyltransferase
MYRQSSDLKPIPLVVVCGPTASGKTALAIKLAEKFDLEILSADSRQVYRGMDIGTAKATREEQACVPHHLIDVVDPDQDFNAADFKVLGRKIIKQIYCRGHLPMVVGGTGLYIKTLTEGLLRVPDGNKKLRQQLLELEPIGGEGVLYRRLQEADPLLAERLHPHDKVRIVRALEVYALTGRRLSELQAEHDFRERPFRTLKVGFSPDRDELYHRIDSRVETMMTSGLLDEVRDLLSKGYSPGLKALQTIGYRQCVLHLRGELSLDEAVALIQRDTRRYAKRQLTWFRKDRSIIWVDYLRESAKIQTLIEDFLQ